MRPRSTTVERILARLGGRAHGVVDRRELLAAGVTAAEIKHRLATGALIPQHPGVYRVGHRAPSIEATYMAAVKAGGREAVLSGLAAAHLWGLVKQAPRSAEITAPTKRRIRGVLARRSHLDRADRDTVKGVPVTAVPRTLVDIAAVLDDDDLARACHQAGVRYRTTPRQVEAVLRRRPNSRGAAKLRRVLRGDTRVSLSALERKFDERLRAAALPLSDETNKVASEHRVDCRWIKQRVTVELDSYRFHNSRYAFEQDRLRERAAYARGDQHRRYTARDVFDEPAAMLAELRGLLV